MESHCNSIRPEWWKISEIVHGWQKNQAVRIAKIAKHANAIKSLVVQGCVRFRKWRKR